MIVTQKENFSDLVHKRYLYEYVILIDLKNISHYLKNRENGFCKNTRIQKLKN